MIIKQNGSSVSHDDKCICSEGKRGKGELGARNGEQRKKNLELEIQEGRKNRLRGIHGNKS